MTGKHLTPEGREQVVMLTRAGYTAPDIAASLGVTDRTVTRVRVASGISQPAPPPLTGDDLRRASELLDDGASYEEIGRTIGRSARSVARAFPGRGWTRQQVGERASLQQRYKGIL